jgi:hypothetical protein
MATNAQERTRDWLARCERRRLLVTGGGSDVADEVARIDASLKADLPHLNRRSGAELTALVTSNAIEVLEEAVHLQGTLAINLIENKPMFDAVRQRWFGILRLLRTHGYSTAAFAPALIKMAVEQDDPDLLSQMDREFRIKWDAIHSVMMPLAIEGIGPRVAPEFAKAIRAGLCEDAKDYLHIDALMSMASENQKLKVMAIVAAAGAYLDARQRSYPLSKHFAKSVDRLPENIGLLLTGNGSNHGKLKLVSMETSLEDVLQRDPSEMFYGHKPGDVQTALHKVGIH